MNKGEFNRLYMCTPEPNTKLQELVELYMELYCTESDSVAMELSKRISHFSKSSGLSSEFIRSAKQMASNRVGPLPGERIKK